MNIDEGKNKPEGASEADRLLEKKEKVVEDYLSFVASKHRERKKLPLNETVESVVFGQPEAIQAKVLRTYDRHNKRAKKYAEHGVPEKLLQAGIKEEIEIEARETRASYIDKRIEMPNQELAKLETMRDLSNLLDNNPSVEDLKKIARVSFDLNGLKVVNDYSGTYANGDKYLKMMKGALENDEIRAWAKDCFGEGKGFKYTACREGGDEFSAVIVSAEPLTEDILNLFIKKVKDVLENDPEAEDCLKMDDDTILRWKHKVPIEEGRKLKIAKLRSEGREIGDNYQLTPEEEEEVFSLAEEWKKNTLIKYRQEIPPGFKFKGKVAAAAATIYDGLMDEANKEKISAIKEGDYEDVLAIMMGCEFATGDRNMHQEKLSHKADKRKSEDLNERFLVGLYDSTRSEDASEELDEEKEKNSTLKELNKLKDEFIALKNFLLAAYESDNSADKEKISFIKLDSLIKEQQIKAVEKKLNFLTKN